MRRRLTTIIALLLICLALPTMASAKNRAYTVLQVPGEAVNNNVAASCYQYSDAWYGLFYSWNGVAFCKGFKSTYNPNTGAVSCQNGLWLFDNSGRFVAADLGDATAICSTEILELPGTITGPRGRRNPAY